MAEYKDGYVPDDMLQVVKSKVRELEQALEDRDIRMAEKDLRITQLEEACTKLTQKVGFETAKVEEGQVKLADARIITDLAIALLKQKPREIIIKYRGESVVSIRPKS